MTLMEGRMTLEELSKWADMRGVTLAGDGLGRGIVPPGDNGPENGLKRAIKAKGKSFADWLGLEDRLQIAVVKYVKLQYPGCLVHHSPGEGRRTPFERFRINQLCVSAGFPDLIIANVKARKVIAIELKVFPNKATENQMIWITWLQGGGIPSKVCTGFEEAKEFIDEQFTA